MRLAVGRRARAASASLVPVLPTEPVTAMTLALRARARGAGEIAQGLEHVVDDQQRRVGGKARALVARDHGERRRRP